MSDKFFVSFNSPQCGWMSVGFEGAGAEFHTTTAYAPHSQALSEILKGLSSLLRAQTPGDGFIVEWSRNPEAYDLLLSRVGSEINFKVIEYPSFDRVNGEAETVFVYEGDIKEFCQAFYETFEQLYKDRNTDEFEFNWRQPFPFDDFENFKKELLDYGR